jgi:hypothetical protein
MSVDTLFGVMALDYPVSNALREVKRRHFLPGPKGQSNSAQD